MVFSSVVFLFLFLPIVFILYIFTPTIKLKNILLLLASLVFYAYGEPKAIAIMVISILMNYFLALCVEKYRKKLFIVITVVANILLLFLFKYLNFMVDLTNSIFNSSISIAEIALPIGISFYTFQAMSYVIDVYRQEAKAQKNIIKLALYISFFPQLIAGPIVKYHDIEAQLSKREFNLNNTAQGLKLFIFGLSAKLLVANTMGSIADKVFSYNTVQLYPALSWIGAIAYTMQIYFDFSGYSSMAIGLGKIFGFTFMENFNLPYISKGIKEFWRRWHISLSTWFKEYVYIPLGGSRRGKMRTMLNLLLVFTLTGLWHGANITFLVWGIVQGLFVVLESIFSDFFNKIPAFVQHIYTMLVVVFAFVIFRADTLNYGINYIGTMFNSSNTNISIAMELLNPLNITIFVIGVLLSVGLHRKIKGLFSEKQASILGYCLSVVLFALCIINIATDAYNPFIYFRF